jgi:methyltransferase-like protein 6
VSDRHYVRQDGTMTYFFTVDEIRQLVEKSGFSVETVDYVERRTVNIKENIDVPRIFVQVARTDDINFFFFTDNPEKLASV